MLINWSGMGRVSDKFQVANQHYGGRLTLAGISEARTTGHVIPRAAHAPHCSETTRSHVGGVPLLERGRGEGPCVVRAVPRPSPFGARMKSNAITAGAVENTRGPGLGVGRAAP